MVTGVNPQEDGEKKLKGGTRSWSTTISGQSVSTSGSMGSPSSRSEAGMTTPASDNTVLRLSHLEIQGDDAGSQGAAGGKKKRGQRATGGDKSNRGLRQFSMKVCEKVESKGRTTYNEVADELVAEFADPITTTSAPDQVQQYEEKNIRRRVYDALNVLMAMDIISKDKKEIQWKGLPRSTVGDIEELKAERTSIKNRIEKRAAYLRELEDQFVGYQNLTQRNQELFGSGNIPSGGVALPFILVQTRPHATVEVEISEDMQLVHFDFNSTPFELHDELFVLKQMKYCERPPNDHMANYPQAPEGQNSGMTGETLQPSQTHAAVVTPTSPPLPGIIKSRVKPER